MTQEPQPRKGSGEKVLGESFPRARGVWDVDRGTA